ncbi:MAG: response regulator [Rhodomicrobium sp.]|nr:response regulator [Rhodomicrobium sp.]
MAVESALNSLVSDVLSVSGRAVSRLDLYRKVNETAQACSRLTNVTAAVGSGLHARFLRLPAEQRQIAVLHSVVGLPCGDIASIMSMNEDAVRHAYAQSLLALRNKPMAVLIIEDEALIARELQEIVISLGLAVAGTAKNRAEALRIAGLSKPKLILADYKLRGDTGVEVVRAIRESIDTNVIYVTAHPDAVAAARETGDIVIPKPFNVRTVECAVQTHLAA